MYNRLTQTAAMNRPDEPASVAEEAKSVRFLPHTVEGQTAVRRQPRAWMDRCYEGETDTAPTPPQTTLAPGPWHPSNLADALLIQSRDPSACAVVFHWKGCHLKACENCAEESERKVGKQGRFFRFFREALGVATVQYQPRECSGRIFSR
jgi:hypothetical protein